MLFTTFCFVVQTLTTPTGFIIYLFECNDIKKGLIPDTFVSEINPSGVALTLSIPHSLNLPRGQTMIQQDRKALKRTWL